MIKEIVSGIAKKVLPMPVRDSIRPYWHRLILPSPEQIRIEEIKRLGPAERWPSITKDEIPWWTRVLDPSNHDPELYPEQRSIRTNPDMALQGYLTVLINAPPGSTVKILDVGSGPLTTLGKKWPERNLEITAIDPNAAEYDLMLERHGIHPLVRTVYGLAEELRFPSSFFDLVHAQNSIDHCFDPMKAILEMLRVVKPGCCVYMIQGIREGKNEKYITNHQWDFFPKRGRFYIERPGMKAVDVGREILGSAAHLSVGMCPNNWFCVTLRRNA